MWNHFLIHFKFLYGPSTLQKPQTLVEEQQLSGRDRGSGCICGARNSVVIPLLGLPRGTESILLCLWPCLLSGPAESWGLIALSLLSSMDQLGRFFFLWYLQPLGQNRRPNCSPCHEIELFLVIKRGCGIQHLVVTSFTVKILEVH